MDARLDPYLELGVPRKASKAEITDAYLHLLCQHHLDIRPPAAHAAASDAALIRTMDAYTNLQDPVPAAHGAWLGYNIPGAEVIVDLAAGHLSDLNAIRWSHSLAHVRGHADLIVR